MEFSARLDSAWCMVNGAWLYGACIRLHHEILNNYLGGGGHFVFSLGKIYFCLGLILEIFSC
jgi:hypothetical protein